MKKILLPILMLLAMVGTSKAQTNAFTVGDIDLPQNYEATLTVSFQLDAADTYTGYSFNLQLPEELEFVMDEGTDVAYVAGSCHAKDHGVAANLSDGLVKVACISNSSKTIVGTSGTLLTFTIKPKSTLTVGNTYTGYIKDILLVPVLGDKKVLSDGTFTVTIGPAEDFDVLLDENSLAEPTAASKVKVKVKRTIREEHWSTICLPFTIKKSDVPTIFGEGCVLAEWKGYDVEKAGDEITGINMNFQVKDGALTNNVPYIIKATKSITDFTVADRDIIIGTPKADFEESVWDDDEEDYRKTVIGSFIGTYKAETVIPSNNLFISDDKFYYSTGKTKEKAFRGYFNIKELSNPSQARVALNITGDDGKTTKIDARTMEPIESGKVYNMAGQYMGEVENTDRLPKGIYIVNGKKTVIK